MTHLLRLAAVVLMLGSGGAGTQGHALAQFNLV